MAIAGGLPNVTAGEKSQREGWCCPSLRLKWLNPGSSQLTMMGSAFLAWCGGGRWCTVCLTLSPFSPCRCAHLAILQPLLPTSRTRSLCFLSCGPQRTYRAATAPSHRWPALHRGTSVPFGPPHLPTTNPPGCHRPLQPATTSTIISTISSPCGHPCLSKEAPSRKLWLQWMGRDKTG